MSFKYFSVLMPHGALDGALSPVELVGKIKPGPWQPYYLDARVKTERL